jgi:predicted Ser/Thr protein kinase
MPSTPSDSSGGREFKGNERFHLLRKLGQGGSGIVYLAHDRQREATVALKTLSGLKPTNLFRFKQEFRGLADIHHPNLVRLHELVHEDGLWFFTMDYIEGTPLEKFVEAGRDAERLRPVLLQIGKGINALHRAGKLHRDLKPENVLITGADRAVILDFGLVMDERRNSHETVDDGWVEGTPAFMSPEQALGDPLTPASDWYAFGAIAYEALTGVLPIDAPYPEILSRKVDVDPEPPSRRVPSLPRDLDQLVWRLLSRDPQARPRGEEVLKVLRRNRPASVRLSLDDVFGPDQRSAFVGRSQQLEQLARALKATDQGKPAAVLVSGSSGMGKTALVEHFLSTLTHASEAVVLRGRCYERESVPFKALDSLIDDLCRYLRKLDDLQLAAVLPRRVDALATLFPVLKRVDAIANYRDRTPLDTDAGKVRAQAYDALRELLGRMADERPLLLFIDDLHWGDLDSAELLRALLTHPEAPALLLIGTFRSDAAGHNPCVRLLRDLASELRVGSRTIEIEPLDAVQSSALLDSLKQEGERLDTASLAREARGNPYFMAELVRFSRLEERPQSSPPTMALVMANRLGSLSDSARRLMELIAVANTPLPMGLLRLCADEGTDVHEAVLELRQQQLIRRVGESSSQVIAHHNLIREAVTELLSVSEQRAHHLRIADALEMSGSDDMEALATHLIGAGEAQRALAHAVRGAKLAERAQAFDQAVRLYELAINHREDGQARRQLQTALADLQLRTGAPSRAAAAYLAAAQGAAPGQSRRLHASAGVAALVAGDLEHGVVELRDAMREHGFAVPTTEAEGMASSEVLWQQVHKRGLGGQPRSDDRIVAQDAERLDECYRLIFAAYCAKTLSAGPLICNHLLDALEVGDARRIVRILCLFHYAVDLPLCQIHGASPLGALERARELATSLTDSYSAACLLAAQSVEAYLRGRWDTALECCRQGVNLLAQCPDAELEAGQLRSIVLTCLLVEGRWPEASRAARTWLGQHQQTSELLADHHQALTAMLGADAVSAATTLQRLDERAAHRAPVERFMRVELLNGALARFTGQADACAEHTRRAHAFADSLIGQVRVYQAIALWSALACQLTRASLERGAAREALVETAEADLERLEGHELPAFEPAVLLSRAALCQLRGDRERALTLLEAAGRVLGTTPRELMVRQRLGLSLGGASGEHLTATASYALREMGCSDPASFSEIFAPGLLPA